jgi:hypothetical protein
MGGTGRKAGGEIKRNEYVSAEKHFSFRMPPGWREVTSRNPFRKPSYLIRIESSGEDAAAEVNEITLGAKSCVDGARAALEGSKSMTFRDPEPFTFKTKGGDLPAWRAEFDAAEGKRKGRVVLFCEGASAIALDVSATSGAYKSVQGELSAVVDSFAYRTAGETALVKPPPPPPTPIAYFTHQVLWRGQTLGQVAKWYTGNYDNWQKFADLNEVQDPNTALKVGREIRIPPGLVVRQDPMAKPRPAAKRPSTEGEPGIKTEEAPPALPSVIGPR